LQWELVYSSKRYLETCAAIRSIVGSTISTALS